MKYRGLVTPEIQLYKAGVNCSRGIATRIGTCHIIWGIADEADPCLSWWEWPRPWDLLRCTDHFIGTARTHGRDGKTERPLSDLENEWMWKDGTDLWCLVGWYVPFVHHSLAYCFSWMKRWMNRWMNRWMYISLQRTFRWEKNISWALEIQFPNLRRLSLLLFVESNRSNILSLVFFTN